MNLPQTPTDSQTILERFQLPQLAVTLCELNYSSVYVSAIVDHARRHRRLTELVEAKVLDLADMPRACEALANDLSDHRRQLRRLTGIAAPAPTAAELARDWPGGAAC
jgi:hypothetical protein